MKKIIAVFNLTDAIAVWRSSMAQNDAFASVDLDELEGHLYDTIDHLTASGLTEEEAF